MLKDIGTAPRRPDDGPSQAGFGAGRAGSMPGSPDPPRFQPTPLREQEIGGGSRRLRSAEDAGDRSAASEEGGKFLPLAPKSRAEVGLSAHELEALVLKHLRAASGVSGADLARLIGLPFSLVNESLAELKEAKLVAVRHAATLTDFVFELTPPGTDRAGNHAEHCPYCGTAPVPLVQYAKSIQAQSLDRVHPSLEDLHRAFDDLQLSDAMLKRLGRAIHAGKALFLYGRPGNGKTSIAERVTRAFGQSIWIPRMLSAWGQTIQLFDPSLHEEMPLSGIQSLVKEQRLDDRWVRIRRPTIVAGGELTLDRLEIRPRQELGISEAPLQLKSNCGTLVIDDFGRQRVSPADLLNRWVVPLEKRYDYLNLGNGRRICVPFDQFVIFSTNLEPRELVDEAFLRRIPYKIETRDPDEAEFRRLFCRIADAMRIEVPGEVLEHLIQNHYKSVGREYRFCHARDLLRQVEVYCEFLGLPAVMTFENIDAAAEDYFSMMA